MENLIEIQDVVKRFGEQTVLDHVSLLSHPENIWNHREGTGSGKTVLFKHLWFYPWMREILARGKQVGEGCDIPQGIELLNIRFSGGIIQAFRNLKPLRVCRRKSCMSR